MASTPPLGTQATPRTRSPASDGAAPTARSDAPTTAPVERPAASPAGRTAKWALIGVVLIGLAYGIGRLQGSLALRDAERQHASERDSLTARVERYQVENDLLEARRHLTLVATALEARNFGIAETERQGALTNLAAAGRRGSVDVRSLESAVRELPLGVAPDPGRARVAALASGEALDRLIASRPRP